jgi:hypothetical protein
MSRALLALTLLALTQSAFAQPQPGKGYPPVTADDVPRLKFNHYFTPDKKHHDVDFEWTFTKDGFTVKKGKGPIAADVVAKLLPDGAAAPDEITGKWKLADGKIVFTDIKAGGKPGRETASYGIYKTAPTVVRIGEPQYVFAVERK